VHGADPQNEIGYSLAFREGAIEAVGVFPPDQRGHKLVALLTIANALQTAWQDATAFHLHYGIEAPFYLMTTLLRDSGYLPRLRPGMSASPRSISKETIMLPEVEIGADRVDLGADALFKPVMDQLAKAFALPSYGPRS
jgi:hypothetical protein